MNYYLNKTIFFLIGLSTLSACITPPSRKELLDQKIVYNRNSDKNYLVIAECLKNNAGFNLPTWNRHTWRDINTFFIYHESILVRGYPQMHDEDTKTYYITEINDPKFSGRINEPILHGNENWIMAIKDVSNTQKTQSVIEIRTNEKLLSDDTSTITHPDSDSDSELSKLLYKAEHVEDCF